MLTFIDFKLTVCERQFRVGTQLTLCGHIVTPGLFAVMGREQSEQREALRTLLTKRAVKCQREKCPLSPRRKNTEHFGTLPNFWNIYLAHCQRTFWNFPFVSVRIISFSVLLLQANILFEGAARAPRVSSFTLKEAQCL